MTYTAPAFVIVPSYCPFDVICEISDITGDSIIIDNDPESNPPSFNFDRFNSLDGVGETQSVTCKAKSKTNYPPDGEDPENPTIPPIESDPGTTSVTPKNPCLDPAFVQIDQLSPPLNEVDYAVS